MSEFINIAAYKFVVLDNLAQRKLHLLPWCRQLGLKGTILLSEEGINLFLAGSRDSIDEFLKRLRQQAEFSDLEVKESISDHQPFSRMLVRLKKEIISMGVESIRPRQKTSPKISAIELKTWLDEGRDIALLDVRNDYEVELGTFEEAIPIGVDHFRKFPEATDRLPDELRGKPVVMFCTGGIRCEKAGPLMEEKGFSQIYQLDGGILKYFEECGGDHYRGDCFVFDKRVAVDPALNETDAEQCYACQAILSPADQQSVLYDPPHHCPHCFKTVPAQMDERLSERAAILHGLTTPLPGSEPYDNSRPMNVSAKFDQQPLVEFLITRHAKLDRDFWVNACQAGRVTYKGRPLAADEIVRAGWRIKHLVPQTVEPPVSNDVQFLYEDDGLIAISKPAPLPMHPCGRFNRNSLEYFMRVAYPQEQISILHRLDAATTGVVLLARKRDVAVKIHRQFAEGKIQKTYLARVVGHPDNDAFRCDAAIGEKPVSAAGMRAVDPQGLPSRTEFTVLKRFDDGTTLVKCFPKTGRTHQIRLHLAHLGWPIEGDIRYGKPVTSSAVPHDQFDPFSKVADPLEMGVEMQLHASEIVFSYRDNPSMTITAPNPTWAEDV